MSRVTDTIGIEDSSATFMARVVGEDGTVLQQAGVTSITFKVYDTTDDSEVATGTLTVSAVIFDALQTDARWTVDATGYNFRHTQAAAAFPTGDRLYRVEYLFTLPGSFVTFVLFDHHVTNVITS